MRVIKFRAWFEGTKQMLGWDMITKLIEGEKLAYVKRQHMGIMYENISTGEVWENPQVYHQIKGNPFMLPELKLLQYTSLLDKNGKEIYEGDILQLHYKNELDTGPTEVKWDGFSFYPFINGCGGCETYFDRATYSITEYWMEVIGNIYENPKLLAGVK